MTDAYIKVTAIVLVAVIIGLVLSRQNADISLLLTLAVCCIVISVALTYFQPVLELIQKLVGLGNLDTSLLDVLLKAVGIGLLSQIAGFVCEDAGNKSLQKALQILSTAVVLCLAVPVLEQMLSLIERVLEEV